MFPDKLPKNNTFSSYQQKVIKSVKDVPSHKVIEKHISKFGEDIRFEESLHPEKELRDRKVDNTQIARP
jgi:hypothetical protein